MPDQNRLLGVLRDERAFGITEALMAMTIMSVVLIALLGLLSTSVKAIASSKMLSFANQIANECVEEVRFLPYTSVGILPSQKTHPDNPSGVLEREETRTVLETEFTINYEVLWVDDTEDGTSTSDADGTQDYKQVFIDVHWVEKDSTRTVSVVTYAKDKVVQTNPPTVNFLFGDPNAGLTMADGTILGTDDSPYKVLFDAGTIPLKSSASDVNNDLTVLRFYIHGTTPDGALYNFDPTGSYENATYWWDPNEVDTSGAYLWNDGTHEVTVEAWDSSGNRDAKSIFWVIDRYPPKWDSPANLSTGSISTSTIGLTWQPAIDYLDQVNKYRIYRKASSDATYTVIEATHTTTENTYSNTGLTEWTTYQYYITALSLGGRESTMTSGEISVTTKFAINGSATRQGNNASVTLTWDTPNTVSVDHFDIYRGGVKVNGSPVSGSAETYTDSGLSRNTTYTYYIIAYDTVGEINRSASLSIVTP